MISAALKYCFAKRGQSTRATTRDSWRAPSAGWIFESALPFFTRRLTNRQKIEMLFGQPTQRHI